MRRAVLRASTCSPSHQAGTAPHLPLPLGFCCSTLSKPHVWISPACRWDYPAGACHLLSPRGSGRTDGGRGPPSSQGGRRWRVHGGRSAPGAAGGSCGRAPAPPVCEGAREEEESEREKANGRAGCGGSSRGWACARPPVLRDRAGGAGGGVWVRGISLCGGGGTTPLQTAGLRGGRCRRRRLPSDVRGSPPCALPSLSLEPPAFPLPPLAHPRPAMPDQISVSEFVSETNEDYKSPTASNFTTRMAQCRNTVAAIEEVSPGGGRGARSPLWPGCREQGATGAGSCRSLSRPARSSALGCRSEEMGLARVERGKKRSGGRAGAPLPRPAGLTLRPPLSARRGRLTRRSQPCEPEPSLLAPPGARGTYRDTGGSVRFPRSWGGNLNSAISLVSPFLHTDT